MFNIFLMLLQISLYFKKDTVPSSVLKDIFFPPLSKYFMNPLICGKIIHKGIMISSASSK